jgi:hypothetical protein
LGDNDCNLNAKFNGNSAVVRGIGFAKLKLEGQGLATELAPATSEGIYLRFKVPFSKQRTQIENTAITSKISRRICKIGGAIAVPHRQNKAPATSAAIR